MSTPTFLQQSSETLIRLLGVRAAERDAPLPRLAEEISGKAGADADLPQKFLLDVLRARGHGGVAEQLDSAGEHRYIVSGAIDRDGPLEGLQVTVVSDSLGGRPAILAKTTTNADGEYSLQFEAETPPIVRLTVADGGKRLFISAPQRAERQLWIEWSAGERPVSRPGLFDLRESVIQAALQPIGRKLEELEESRERLEIALVAEATGMSRAHVATHAVAARLEKELEIPRAVLFALLGETLAPTAWSRPSPRLASIPADGGLPAEFFEQLRREAAENRLPERVLALARQIVLSADEAVVRSAVDRAVRAGTLSPRVERDLDRVVARLGAARQRAVLEGKPGESSTWTELLDAAGLSKDEAQAAAPLLIETPPGAPLWSGIAKLVGGDRGKQAATTLALGPLVGFDARALRLVRERRIDHVRQLASLSDRALEKLLKEAFAHRADADAARRSTIERLDIQAPGESIVRRVHDRLDPLAVEFLQRADGPSVDLLALNVEELYRSRRLSRDDDEARRIRHEVLRVQRVARVTRNGRVGAQLMERGYDSAAKIAFTDRRQFLDEARGAASSAELTLVHRRARAHYRATLGVFVRLNQAANGPALAVMNAPGDLIAAASIQGAPSWEFLFGSADYCDCEHCSSVTSPAAYLVDLLIWLQRAPGPAPRPFEVLDLRRPDLVKILLNCKNTLTLVPYIDLVCELLEEAVAIRVDARANPGNPLLTPQVLAARRRARQTTLTAEEIRAYPEHVDIAVYSGVLSQYAESFVAPFDLAAAEIREYLALKAVTRIELMTLFGTGTPGERAAERFAIAQVERGLVTAAAANQAAQTAQWGFAGPIVPLEDYLRRAPSPTRPKAHLSYDELLSLLRGAFPNPQRADPNQAVAIELEPGVTADLCRATDRRIVRLTHDALDRQHRFLRLARHVRWSLAELDLLITAVGQGRIDEAALVALSDCAVAADRLALSAEEIAFLFRDFDASQAAAGATFAERPTLYARLFLSRTDGGGPPAVFRDPAANPTPIAAERQRIAGALVISGTELDEILSRANLAAADISFQSLSTLYRHARLTRALGLRAAQFEILRGAHVDPFASTANLVSFADAAALLAEMPAADISTNETLAALTNVAPVTVPDAAPLVAALDALFQATSAQIALDTGALPPRPDVIAQIVQRHTWSAVVVSWLGIDSRFAATAVALAGPGVAPIVDGLYANPPQADVLRLFARLRVLIGAFRVPAESAGRLPLLPGVFAVVSQPSWARLANAIQALSLAATARSAADLQPFFEGVADNAVTRAVLAERLAAALGLEPAIVEGVWDAFFGAGVVDRNALVDSGHYRRLRRVAELSRTLRADPATVSSWAAPWPTDAHAVSVRNAFRGGMETAEWLKASTLVQNAMRERRRDALVQYLLATAGAGEPTTAAALSGQFLIDVEMDDCMNTSRMVQANASIQLYVQRCFLGLENISRAELATDHWKQWDWRNRYRLWEANRMVFLYPENFLNVARRSNASPLFVDFMKEVRQAEGSEEAVRVALDGYLAGLERLGNLEYAALSANLGEAGYTPELHVVARTRETPQKHYHRRLSGGVWGPWDELSVGTPGRHLALAYRGGTTTLAWPTFADHPDPRQRVPAAEEGPSQEAPASAGVSYLSYAWVLKDRRNWTTVQTSSRALLHRKRARRPFTTVLRPTTTSLGLTVYAPKAPATAAEQTTSTTIPQLGRIDLERDIVSITVFAGRRALSSWLGGDHQPHIDATATFEPIVCSLGNDCNCLIAMDSSLVPWPGLVFDDNTMIAPLGTTALRIGVETANPQQRQTVTLLDSSTFSIAVDAGSIRPAGEGVSAVGQTPFGTYLIWDFVIDFAPHAFAFNDARRSFLCLSAAAVSSLAPAAEGPASGRWLVMPGYHPFATDLRTVVRRYNDGLERVYSARTQETPATLGRAPLVFAAEYGTHNVTAFSSPSEAFEFEAIAPYALYNWEVFFHAPLFVAEQLRGALSFENARRYYHFIFTPFTAEPIDPLRPKARYWVTKPFREAQATTGDIAEILTNGAIAHVNPYADIEAHPFDAQLVAQARPSAYQRHVVMRYIDNLMNWADSLFRRAQREDVYEAIQLYQLVESILGVRPERLRPLGTRRDLAFEDEDWRGGANALVDLESVVLDAGAEPEETGDTPLVELPLVPGLYFCIPPNRKLLDYWDTLERRLDNLRHCRTIDGRPIEYDLLAAPIDIQALVDAAAAGVSVADALDLAGRTLPPYRFRTIWSKAQDVCNDAKSLGSALQSALEKRDAEQVSLLRSLWEGRLLETTRRTRETQRDQAQSEVEALQQQRRTVEARRTYFQSLETMNELERAALGLTIAAATLDTVGFVFDVLGGVLYLIPNVNLGVSGFGGTPQAGANIGGQNVGDSVSRSSQGLSRMAGLLDRAGGMVTTQATYARRKEDWDHQAAEAALELEHIDKQIAAAKLRVAIATAELEGHARQEQSWAATDALLKEKFTNEERFEWMIERLAELYQDAFQQALKLARLAREGLTFEMPPTTAVPAIGPTHWDSLQHGLLSGERLAADLRALDVTAATVATHEREITHHVPLSQIAPDALIALRRTGNCNFRIPRWWFQRFDPALINRRVKTLSVSVPCVTGPYVGMNATLSLQGTHRTRASISLSTGINDFGVSAGDDDRYMPFEGLSLEAETRWTFGFPVDPANAGVALTDVDYSTISDVVLHFQYTADVGGPALDGPPALVAFVDLRQMDAAAWTELVSGQLHQATVDVLSLVPRFLAGYRVDSLADTIALMRDGSAVTGRFSFTLDAAAAGTVTIALRATEAVDWARLSRIYIVANMRR